MSGSKIVLLKIALMEPAHLELWNDVDCFSCFSSVWLYQALFSKRFRWRFCNLTSIKWSMTQCWRQLVFFQWPTHLSIFRAEILPECPSWPPGIQKQQLSQFYRYSARGNDRDHRVAVKMLASFHVLYRLKLKPLKIPYLHHRDRT